jgi:hypothetical protein
LDEKPFCVVFDSGGGRREGGREKENELSVLSIYLFVCFEFIALVLIATGTAQRRQTVARSPHYAQPINIILVPPWFRI